MWPLAFHTNDLAVETRGMQAQGQPEIRVSVNSASLLPECERFLRFVADYLEHSERRIKPGETMNYGYWLVKFQPVGDELEVWEYNDDATVFVRGGSLALRYWRDQQNVCGRYGATFSPPRPEKLTAVSEGVMEGLPVQAVRYNLEEHMSGWLIVTEKWDKQISALKTYHTYHLTANRPDLARFLALPPGFRFDLTGVERVWFDAEAAERALV